ncbi:MAG: hypothetical protein WBC74_04815 [Candidatus Omnitrophota bacterium]
MSPRKGKVIDSGDSFRAFRKSRNAKISNGRSNITTFQKPGAKEKAGRKAYNNPTKIGSEKRNLTHPVKKILYFFRITLDKAAVVAVKKAQASERKNHIICGVFYTSKTESKSP